MDKAKITDKGIKSIEINKKQYFDLEQIIKTFTEVKVDIEQVIKVDDSFYVQAKDVHLKTDFDNKINQALNFNPKEK